MKADSTADRDADVHARLNVLLAGAALVLAGLGVSELFWAAGCLVASGVGFAYWAAFRSFVAIVPSRPLARRLDAGFERFAVFCRSLDRFAAPRR